MSRIDFLTDDDIKFLNDLAHDLKTQDRAFTAKPVYYTIREKEIVFGLDPEYADDTCLIIGEDYETVFNLEEAIEFLKDNYELTEADLAGRNDLDAISMFLEERGINCTLTGYSYQDKHSGAFLTKTGAEKHIEINGHNLKNPTVYCHHAFRNPELERLLAIVEKFDR